MSLRWIVAAAVLSTGLAAGVESASALPIASVTGPSVVERTAVIVTKRVVRRPVVKRVIVR